MVAAAAKVEAYLKAKGTTMRPITGFFVEPITHLSRVDGLALSENWSLLRGAEGFGIDLQTGELNSHYPHSRYLALPNGAGILSHFCGPR